MCLPGFLDPETRDSAAGLLQSNAMCVRENTFPVAIVATIAIAATLMTAGVTAMYFHMKRKLELQMRETARLEEEKEQRVQSKVKQGLETVQKLRHPMCVVRHETFLGTPNEDLFKTTHHEAMSQAIAKP